MRDIWSTVRFEGSHVLAGAMDSQGFVTLSWMSVEYISCDRDNICGMRMDLTKLVLRGRCNEIMAWIALPFSCQAQHFVHFWQGTVTK